MWPGGTVHWTLHLLQQTALSAQPSGLVIVHNVTELNTWASNSCQVFFRDFSLQNPQLVISAFLHCSHPYHGSHRITFLFLFCQILFYFLVFYYYYSVSHRKKKSTSFNFPREHSVPFLCSPAAVVMQLLARSSNSALHVFLWNRPFRKCCSDKGRGSHFKTSWYFPHNFSLWLAFWMSPEIRALAL